MFEHQKVILQNVSDNKVLFRKELMKSIQWLKSSEISQLRKWLAKNFNGQHKIIIDEVFNSTFN